MSTIALPLRVADDRPHFLERVSQTRIEAFSPRERPDLWAAYLEGAVESYRAFGVEKALDIQEIHNGLSTPLFWVARSIEGKVVAGMRVHGPFLEVDQAHVVDEFRGDVGLARVREMLALRIPHGVIEIKGCWVTPGIEGQANLSDALARCYVHSMDYFNVRFACCSAALHASRRWVRSGGQIDQELKPIPYPDDRYETTMLWWDRERLGDDVHPTQMGLMLDERRQLREGQTRVQSASRYIDPLLFDDLPVRGKLPVHRAA
jgi:hypothetical protein